MKTHLALAFASLAAMGCSGTVRSMTATHWTTGPDAADAVSPAAPAAGDAAAAGAAPAAAPAAAGRKGQRVFYVTYWEGSCTKGFIYGSGCAKGNSHVKRCNLQPDNSLVCVDEKNIGNALSTGE